MVIPNNKDNILFVIDCIVDFNHSHKNEKDYNPPLSLSCMLRIFEKNNDISIIISENKRNKNGFFTNNDKLTYKYWNNITNIVEEKN